MQKKRDKSGGDLLAREQLYAAIFRKSNFPLILIQLPEGIIAEVNDATELMSGFSREELIGRTSVELGLVNRAQRDVVLNQVRGARIVGDSEVRLVTKSGEERILLINSTPMEVNGRHYACTSCVDITARKKVEKALEESEQRFMTFFRSNPVPVGITRASDFRLEAVNDAWCKLTGYSLEEAAGHTSAELGLARPGTLQSVKNKIRNQGQIEQDEIEMFTRSGQLRQMQISSVPFELDGKVYFLNNLLDITERKENEKLLTEQSRQLHALAAHMQSVREEERKRVARFIHDEFVQVLSALRMDISMVELSLKKSGRTTETENAISELSRSKEIISGTIENIRKLMTELRPGILDIYGLIPALRWHVNEFSKQSGIPCEFSTSSEEIGFDDDSNIALFRIVQEALANIQKHAGASSAKVEIKMKKDLLTLYVSDNGCGFDPGAVDTTRSFGLLGMKERVAILNGNMKINSGKGKGTVIQIQSRIK